MNTVQIIIIIHNNVYPEAIHTQLPTTYLLTGSTQSLLEQDEEMIQFNKKGRKVFKQISKMIDMT